jgi:hypothetical protein
MRMSASPLLAVAALWALLGAASAPALAEPSSTNVPTNAYHDNPLTADEKEAIAEEEAVTPDDGKASVPAPQDQGVIPDAIIDQPKAAASEPKPGHTNKKTAESEADVILDQSKKNDPVTKKAMDECMSAWDPQTQMSKSEWETSCRTTLEYFPEKD